MPQPRRASRVRRTSPGLSSTSRIGTPRPAVPTGRGGCSVVPMALPSFIRGPVACCVPGVGGRGGPGVRVGDGEDHSAAAAGVVLDPDDAVVALHDLLHDGQADTGAGVDVAGVQSLEPVSY